MGVQRKLAILFMTLAVIFGGTMAGLQWWQEQQASKQLKEKSTAFLRDSEQLFHNILAIKAVSLAALSDSFAFWDEVVEFIAKNDIEWAQNNLDSGLPVFEAHVMWVYDKAGKLVYYTDDRPESDYAN